MMVCLDCLGIDMLHGKTNLVQISRPGRLF